MSERTVLLPELEEDFQPLALEEENFLQELRRNGQIRRAVIALERSPQSISVFETESGPEEDPRSFRLLERTVKSLLWICGGVKIRIAGAPMLTEQLSRCYAPGGDRAFDAAFMSRIFRQEFSISAAREDELVSCEPEKQPGLHTNGCRIGFDLGGTSIKYASVRDGVPVETGIVRWDPYFEKDPARHRAAINEALHRAAAALPRVDAVGGSTAGVVFDNCLRVSSLFRGIPEDLFEQKISGLFRDLQAEWQVPFSVANDGEVTALAGASEWRSSGVLGVSMGTSQAGGWVDGNGNITDHLNELAFVPVDLRPDAPADEWSGDRGCGVQYFSIQGVARLAELAGIPFAEGVSFGERCAGTLDLAEQGDGRALAVYRSMGVCFGYAAAWYARFYPGLQTVLLLGGAASGTGGSVLLSQAQKVLKQQFPALAERVVFRSGEGGKTESRFAQALNAAFLPEIKK